MASNNVKFDVIDDNPEDKQNFDKTVIDPQSTASSESATSTSGQSYQDTGAIPKSRTSILSNSGLLPTAETSNNDEQTLQRLCHCIAEAIREGIQSKEDNRPNYRGIEKPKINYFDGDASQYQHWKSMFQLIYTEDRNLPESYLATALFGLLDGEAKRAVEIHITAKWDGTNYQEMWKQLDLRYGTKHVQARCIRDKANQIPYLDTLTLKSTLAFYEGVTVQVNHHLVQQPHAVKDDNSHLYQFLKEKMSDKLVDKYIEYLDSDIHDTPLERTVLTLQHWLERQISRLQEVEITSTTSKLHSSKSPHRQVTTGYVDNNEVDYLDNEDVSEYDSDENPSHTILRTNLSGDTVHYITRRISTISLNLIPEFKLRRHPSTPELQLQHLLLTPELNPQEEQFMPSWLGQVKNVTCAELLLMNSPIARNSRNYQFSSATAQFQDPVPVITV